MAQHGDQRAHSSTVDGALLVAQPLVVRHEQIHLEVHNGGGGLALTSAFIVVTATEKAVGYLGLGSLKPGEYVRVRTTLRPPAPSTNVRGIVVCRDTAGAVWAWQLGGVDPREIARLVDISGEEPRGDTIFAQYFPDIDLGQLHPVACDVLTPAELEKVRSESTERLRDLPI